MKVHTEYLTFNTRDKIEFIHITPQIEKILVKSGVKEGLCLVAPMHTTASVFVNDHENGLMEDLKHLLEQLVPFSPGKYKHNQTGEDNAHAHIKRSLLGRESVLPVTNGELDLGTWGQVFYAEFDGQREKRVIVKIIGE